MTSVVVATTLRRLGREPTRVVVCVLAAFLIGSILGPRPPPIVGGLFAVLLGVGVISREASSGTLALALTRPIRRRDYVFAKWWAVSLAAIAASTATVGFGLVNHGGLGIATVATSLATQTLSSVGAAAVVVALSTFSRGYSDAGLWVVGTALSGLLKLYGGITAKGWMVRVGTDVQALLVPVIDLEQLRYTVDMPFFAILSYLSAVAVALAVAVVCLNRRELSYATT
jgi:ABC-type transport system involved in multi-copper enzyme maturation permease subunit